jgi:hypothetical protein
MVSLKFHSVVATCSIVTMFLAAPTESSAFDALDRLMGWGAYRTDYGTPYVTYRTPYATYYAPSPSRVPSCGPSCAPCATQTCRYVQQTCYRTVCRSVPVTTYLAVTGCDPCTGRQVTAYRPVTVWTTKTQTVPYTTYRLIYSPPCAVKSSCAPCGSPPSTRSVSSCCTSSVNISAPLVPIPAASVQPATGTLRSLGNSQSPSAKVGIEPSSNPIPDATPVVPKVLPDRTTSFRVRRASHFQQVSAPQESAELQKTPIQKTPADYGGWRASNR